MRTSLTDVLIEKLPPAEGRHYVVDDAKQNGLQLQITPGGNRTWLAFYRIDGQRRRPRIGRWPEMSIDAARRKVRGIIADADNGIDYSVERLDARKGLTVKEFCDEVFLPDAKKRMKPRSFIEHKRRLELHILPALGSSKLSAVSTADIRRLHDKLSKTPVGANRVAGLVKTMFNVAVLKGCLPENHVNPANKIKPNKEQPRERFLQVEEVARLAKAIAKAEESGNESRHALAAIKLLLLTGARRDEILALEWSFVDLDGAVLNLPDSKTGKKPIYLNPGAVEVLRELEKIRTEGNPYVIEGHCHGKRLIGIHRIWERIRTSAKLAGLRLHDLRHSFASAALWNGVNLATVGKLLGHKDSRTTQRYGHIADRVAIDAAATVGTALSNMMAANVVEIGGKSHESQSNGETQS